MEIIHYDFVVIGSGIAGLSAARHLSRHGEVCILTKSHVRESSTQYAQGGIAVAMHSEDTPHYHFEDTMNAGAGLCNKNAVRVLVEDGPDRVRELIELGANFDRTGNDFHFTQEAAHGKRRILHAGDATGREIEKTLGNTLLNEGKVKFYSETSALRLLLKDGECVGCLASRHGRLMAVLARAVLICSGGCGQIYMHNTNPPVATGDGIALGFEAGCAVQDMEFIQFHPTTLYLGDKKPISLFLISEAVRGEGAVLRNIHGERFMPAYHPAAELAPRDVVARAIFDEMLRTQAQHVYLDLSRLDFDVAARFPTIYQRCLEAKIDIRRDFIPVAPGAHYFMGGLKTTINGETTIPRLYAAGEVSSLGLHGANRLASNSLLDGLVFGHRAARQAVECTPVAQFPSPEELTLLTLEDDISPRQKAHILTVKQEIRDIMWRYAGLVRDEEGLSHALRRLLKKSGILRLKTHQPALREVQHMLTVASLIVYFARMRKESRGAHYRRDYPKTDHTWQRRIVTNRHNEFTTEAV